MPFLILVMLRLVPSLPSSYTVTATTHKIWQERESRVASRENWVWKMLLWWQNLGSKCESTVKVLISCGCSHVSGSVLGMTESVHQSITLVQMPQQLFDELQWNVSPEDKPYWLWWFLDFFLLLLLVRWNISTTVDDLDEVQQNVVRTFIVSREWTPMTLVFPWLFFYCQHEVVICGSEWNILTTFERISTD